MGGRRHTEESYFKTLFYSSEQGQYGPRNVIWNGWQWQWQWHIPYWRRQLRQGEEDLANTLKEEQQGVALNDFKGDKKGKFTTKSMYEIIELKTRYTTENHQLLSTYDWKRIFEHVPLFLNTTHVCVIGSQFS